jgi:aminoglycoside phosphotransferase (APT) family kinase protein
VGDPLCDLAISRLDICCIFGAAAMACFTDAYQAALGLDDSHLPAWDLWAALRLVRMAAGDFAGWAAFYPPVGRADITAASLHAQYQAFVGAALARLESTHL